ncbi:deoxyribose-phosphate aldolase [Halovenus rubra]|uniref:Deoxyribose-phosphate aldolase n=2 Tax=Halovenus rubra TaxID=869890 RepID=A0ABD5X6Y3_9EURY|nr:deoxyribose-phosphate aldolase [Halovenus rubra]
MEAIADKIEHTVLGPETTWTDVKTVLEEASQYEMRACIPPCYLEQANEYEPSVDLTTVVGFPHGQHLTETKCQEASHAWAAGAAEIDVVANIGYIKSGHFDTLKSELGEVVAAVPVPVKVILEAPLLTDEELKNASRVAAEADVDYLKTATGFSEGGATVHDVELMSRHKPVKASGGVGSWSFAKELFNAGATRIGASSGVAIVEGYREKHRD